jgi:hypothetical protein
MAKRAEILLARESLAGYPPPLTVAVGWLRLKRPEPVSRGEAETAPDFKSRRGCSAVQLRPVRISARSRLRRDGSANEPRGS